MSGFLDVTILSVLQGVAEFLPISSSGHLVIGQHLLGVNEPGMRLDVMLHFGTLVSICAFYWRTILRIVTRFEWRYVLKIVLSALPAIAVYVCLKSTIEGLFENAKAVGACLVFTGVVLAGTRFMPRGGRDVDWLRAFLMGCAQAVALLPGVSRSGMTLAGARAGDEGYDAAVARKAGAAVDNGGDGKFDSFGHGASSGGIGGLRQDPKAPPRPASRVSRPGWRRPPS